MSDDDDNDALLDAFEEFLVATVTADKKTAKLLNKLVKADYPAAVDAVIALLTGPAVDNPLVRNYSGFAEKILRSRGGAGRALERQLLDTIHNDPTILDHGTLTDDQVSQLREMAGLPPRSQ